MSVVPVGAPEPRGHQLRRIDRPAIEIRDFVRVRRVGEINDVQSALVPPLRHQVAARNRNERPIVRDAVLRVGLRGRHLEVRTLYHLAVRDREDRVAAPVDRIVEPALGRRAAAPLIREQHLRSVIVEGGRMPEGEVGISSGLQALRIERIVDVDQQSVAAARAAREPDRRIHRDVVTLVGTDGRRIGTRAASATRAGTTRRASSATPACRRVPRRGAVRLGRRQVIEDATERNDLRLLGMIERHANDFDAETRRTHRIPREVVASRQFGGRPHPRRAGDVHVDDVLVRGIGNECVRVRAAARLHVDDLFRMGHVRDVVDSHADRPVLAHGILNALCAAIRAVAGALGRNEEQVAVDRRIALPRRAYGRVLENGIRGVRDVPHLESAEVALEDVVAAEGQVGVRERQSTRPAFTGEHVRLRVVRDERDVVRDLRRVRETGAESDTRVRGGRFRGHRRQRDRCHGGHRRRRRTG